MISPKDKLRLVRYPHKKKGNDDFGYFHGFFQWTDKIVALVEDRDTGKIHTLRHDAITFTD